MCIDLLRCGAMFRSYTKTRARARGCARGSGTHQTVLHVPILDVLAGGYAVRNIEVNELSRQINSGRQPIHHLHGV